MTALRDHGHDISRFDDDQFTQLIDRLDRLIELATPGYEASKLMLAQLQAQLQVAQPRPDQPPETDHGSVETADEG